ncbi:MAG: hypothetical protein K8J31_08540 [Anaerolineae bacterium]|nr:hypothetical protein [Anaerolineae bacterium]
METALTILAGVALVLYGTCGLRRRQIGWSLEPIITTTLTGPPGLIFSAACILGGTVLALPLLVALLTQQPTDTLFIQVATNAGLPIAAIGFMLAIFVQLAIDLGHFIQRLKDRSES